MSFGKELTNLAKKYNMKNLVCSAAQEDGNGSTIIMGNNPELLIALGLSTAKDTFEKVTKHLVEEEEEKDPLDDLSQDELEMVRKLADKIRKELGI